ncbi:hypothetical protein NDGK_01640 [Clostridiales bacterium CHKCI001]|nr:hypothetical protein NDGK_01640 [Clostridiales bacterium CHKCI001]
MKLNEMELQTIRHLIMANDTTSCKMSAYAQQAQTPEIRQYFEKAAQTATDAKNELMGFLK